jgi:predicted restriction endonuclease
MATTYRILRDTAVARQLKADHECRCQICGITIELPDGTRYAEAHHVRPLGSPHDGPDVRENMVVLCPNHHAMCDYGVIRLSVDTLRRIADHIVDPAFIAYHNDRVYRPVVVV